MRIKKTASLLAAFGLAFSLAACGGDGKDDAKVTKEEFTKGYVTGMKSVFKRAPEAQLKQLAECTYQKINGKVDDSTMKIISLLAAVKRKKPSPLKIKRLFKPPQKSALVNS